MLVIIDESGDPSFSFKSSEYFSITAVIFDNTKDAEQISKLIRNFKIKHNLETELKYSKMKATVIQKFFEIIGEDKCFEVFSYSVKKQSIKDHQLRKEPKKLYFYVLKKLLSEIKEPKNDHISFKIDKLNDKNFRKNFNKILSAKFPKSKVGFINSQSDNLVQLADMYSGHINSKLKSREIKQGMFRYKSSV